MKAQTIAVATAAVGLLGGPIAPGVHDLQSIEPRDGAATLSDDMWETIRVSDAPEGIVLETATVRGLATNPPHRVNARLSEGPPVALVHTCGAMGDQAASYSTAGGGLQLLLPGDGGLGQVMYSFVRRAG